MTAILSICCAIFGISSQTCVAGDVGLDGAEWAASGSADLHVKGLELARAAVHPQEDAAFLFFPGLVGDAADPNRSPQFMNTPPADVARVPLRKRSAEVFGGFAKRVHREISRKAM